MVTQGEDQRHFLGIKNSLIDFGKLRSLCRGAVIRQVAGDQHGIKALFAVLGSDIVQCLIGILDPQHRVDAGTAAAQMGVGNSAELQHDLTLVKVNRCSGIH